MNRRSQAVWDERHHSSDTGSAEPSLLEFMPMLPRGCALDIAAGKGRNSIALARGGMRVVAVDWSQTAMNSLARLARTEQLGIDPVIADLEQSLPFQPQSFDVVLNISFLERGLFPRLKMMLRIGGMLGV